MDDILTFPNTPGASAPQRVEETTYAEFFKKLFKSGALLGTVRLADKGMFETLVGTMSDIDETTKKQLGLDMKAQATNTERDQNKKTKNWWYKVLKSKFFDKSLGFFKKMGSTSFITTLAMILVLLKTGILKTFINWALPIVKDMIVFVIKQIPKVLKWIWNFLKDDAPKYFKEIFNAIFDTIGLNKDNPIRKLFDSLSEYLPLILAAIIALNKTGAGGLLSGGLGKLVGALGLGTAGVTVGLGAAALAPLLGVLNESLHLTNDQLKSLDNAQKKGLKLNDKQLRTLQAKETMDRYNDAGWNGTPQIDPEASMFIREKIYDYFSNNVRKSKELLSDLGDIITNFFYGNVQKGNKILSNFGNTITSFMKNWIASANRIWKWIKEIPGKIKQFFLDLWEGVKERFSRIGEVFSDLPGLIKDKLAGAFGGLGDAIKSAFENILDWFIDIGRYGVSAIRDDEGMAEIRKNREIIKQSDDPLMQLIRGEVNVHASDKQRNEFEAIKQAAKDAGDDDLVKFMADAMAGRKKDFNITKKEVSKSDIARQIIPTRFLDGNRNATREKER